MKKIEINDQGEITLETTLTPGQVSKFNGLIQKMIIEDGAAYIPIDELHGVLLTNSRERAKTIVNNYQDTVKAYLVTEPIRFQKYGVIAAIRPMGLYNLLEALAHDNPKRATDYRASLALLAYIVAKHPQLALSSSIKAKYKEAVQNSVIAKLKRNHNICQLSQESFTHDDEKHVHHIEGESEEPSLAHDEKNLIVIKGSIHIDYHNWINIQKLPINKYTLMQYVVKNNYSLPIIQQFSTQ